MKNVPAAALCLLAALRAGALPGGVSPRTGPVDRFECWITNDAAGLAPVDEWDDLRTFGFELGVGLSARLAVHTDYQSFTWRSDSPSTASRIDSLGLALSGVLLDATTRRTRLVSRASVGASLFGDLGGLALQSGHHGWMGIGRSCPETYDAYSSTALALTIAGEASTKDGVVRPALFASVDGDIPGSWRIQGGARVTVGSAGAGGEAWALFRHQTPAGLSPTLDAVSRMASGVTGGFEVEAAWLSCSTQFNICTGVSESAVGIRVGRRAGDEGPCPVPVALEFHLDPTMADSGSKVLFPLVRPGPNGSTLRGSAGAFLGWLRLPGSSTVGLRSAEYSVGMEARLCLPMGRLEGELACALEPVARVLTVQPLCMERSSVQDTCLLLSARLAPALRIGFVDRHPSGTVRKAGLGVALGLEAPALTLVPFASWQAESARTFTLRLFLFGESL
jgi:hypothetical protein